MKKTFLLFLTIVFGALQCAWAAPLKNIEVRLTQPNGQVIHCFASGDEFYNYLHDANGFTIVKGEGGYYCYAMYDNQGEVIASPYRVNSVDPAEVGLQPYVKISEKAYQERRQARLQHIKPIKRPADRELNHGRYNNLVVFIRFAGDTYHSTPFSTVDSMFNASNYESISLHNYFHHASYNQLDLRSYCYPEPDGETILSYEDIHPKEYYMPFDPVTNPIGYQDGETAEREFSMLERAIYYVADQVPDTLDLDYNDDGMVDNVVFVIKGQPGEWASLLWPHRWCIYDREVWLNGLRVYDFNLQLEIGGYFNVSTLCHEMNHSLGAPDLYHYNGGPNPVGSWDLMCGTTEPPQQIGMYMKYKYGNWINDIPIINAYGTYELEADSWEGNRRNAYMIELTNDQYLCLEYRNDRDLFDSNVPDGGLLIYRIDFRFDGNAGYNGYNQFDEVYLFRPDGNPNNEGDIDHANFCAERTRTEFNQHTNPNIFLTNGQPIDWQGSIYDISTRGDRMSFTYGPLNHLPAPTNFVAHVNSLTHQVELSWNAMPDAEGYHVYCDGFEVATQLTDTCYVHPYSDSDAGYHIYYVASYQGDTWSDYAEQWVILGNYETIHLSITSDSPFGTKGGELEVSYNLSEMKTEYLTIYEGTQAEANLYVHANTEVTFNWNAGFDPESQGIQVKATRLNASGEETIFDMVAPASGTIATYTVADNGLGIILPQHVTAVSNGPEIQLQWAVPTENSTFEIYRDGRKTATLEGYSYLDDKIMRSGTHNYHVENTYGNISSWNPDNLVYATTMNYYCEPPQNLEGTYSDGHVELAWDTPAFVGHGMLAYDNNHFVERIGSNSHKWGIKIEPEHLALFEGRPLVYVEVFNCSAGTYTFTIYNGEQANNNTSIYTQQCAMEGINDWVKVALDEPVDYDPTLPLWVCVGTSGAQTPIPCCDYVGNGNSCMIKQGNQWKPVTNFGTYRSWMLRAYTNPIENAGNFTYNVYWGPEEGGIEQLELGYETLTATQANHNTTANQRYNVTALWDGRETELSNTIYLGPSVGIEETINQEDALVVYPNPVSDKLTLQSDGMQHVRLVTLTGACVYECTTKHHEVKIDMAELPQGLYFLIVQTENGTSIKKVIKR